MKFYAIRHGETDWNKLGKIQGKTNIELNENGIKQANEVAKQVAEYKFDLIISSPLKRAAKTAEIVSNGEIPIIFSEGIVERCFGDFEGCTAEEFDFSKCYDCDINLSGNGLEPVNDLMTRVHNFLEEMKNTYENKKILLVTHGGTLRAINACCNGVPDNNLLNATFTKNCQIREFEY